MPDARLTAAILALLQAEAGKPPLSDEKVIECMRCTGLGLGATPPEIDAALAELQRDGKIEAVRYRGKARWRVSHNKQVGNG